MRFVLMLFALLLAVPALAQSDLKSVVPVMACSDLIALDLTGIGGAGSVVSAAQETTSGGIAVCSVTGTLAPEVNFQVLLPMVGWTQRYLQLGCGGPCGNISLRSGASVGCQVLNDGGFVMAATDMGHSGMGAKRGLDDAMRADFAHRAQHITALAAKALTQAFYGQAAAYSYFNGCSDGGREALMEAMRYPDDFDGIIAGALAMLFQVQNTLHHGWLARANTSADGKAILLSGKLPALHAGVMAACDVHDGLADGLISQPALCAFDPATIQCAAGVDDATCLTAPEVAIARAVYDGPRDPSGAALTPGQPLAGSELNWQGVFVPDDAGMPLFSKIIAEPVLKNLAFDPPRPKMTLADLEFSMSTPEALRTRHPQIDATNPDLRAFQAAGGKLILWHGLADPHIAPANTVALHRAMIATIRDDTVVGFNRLYLIPGMGICGGGRGPTEFDLLTRMLAWVETGTAPGAILTSTTAQVSTFGQPDGGDGGHGGMPPPAALGVAPLPDMTRPVWPLPATARYIGSGDPNVAASWTQGPDAEIVALRDWAGADFFTPYMSEN